MSDDPLRLTLGITRTKQGVALYRSEVERGLTLLDASEWTEHPAEAIIDGRALLEHARSDQAYAEARYEATKLFAHAS